MKREFKFKENYSNIEKVFQYAKYKCPRLRNRIEYDEYGYFIFFKKDDRTHYFYYLKNTDLWFSLYKNSVIKIDKKIIKDFKQKVYNDNKLKAILDKILKPLR
jgi:hypothetical protein